MIPFSLTNTAGGGCFAPTARKLGESVADLLFLGSFTASRMGMIWSRLTSYLSTVIHSGKHPRAMGTAKLNEFEAGTLRSAGAEGADHSERPVADAISHRISGPLRDMYMTCHPERSAAKMLSRT